MAKIIEGLYYSESHEFVKVEGEYAYIGITDFAQGQLGNVTYIEFPSPISGVVVEVNEVLEDEPELVNKDAYSNWLIKVKLSDPSELESLMDAQAYTDICK